ncbi:acetolactate synthase small subunit [Stigmatella aurantiaca]|uniref:Acetolactate synthase small subunit n=1 Tax=Stigmatella aurantiaca (strain DW4/3-1) TaxID=378806 RepID=Q08PW5_STIAD|nr:acetolactate synthase small subunit [Stigmatella aurantiaca]ADO74561.1 Acetolactate synthase, small subunit [Stigmatella aurantiaca DW4/3-1]EAU62515.1 acetolactate synthase, small subunit [Stigmatella aurantiaca DW4/3-1]
MTPQPPPRTFIVHVEDRPGVLSRVISLFRRRAYNIDSLTVANTENASLSRITLVMAADEREARLLEANLYKLIEVLYVEHATPQGQVSRELALIKVRASEETRPAVLQVCEVFRARAIDVTPTSMVMELTGAPDKIDGLIEMLRPHGIIELARTGTVAMARGPQSPLTALLETPPPGKAA